MTTIAQMTGIRRQDVPRTIRRLEQRRLLRCEPGGPTRPNVYHLSLDDGEGVSAAARTGVRHTADRVSANQGDLVSAAVRTEQLREHILDAYAHRPAARSARARVRDRVEEVANSEFETFWRIYPSRHPHANPRKPARAKFEAVVKRGIDPADIIRSAENYQAAIESAGTDPRYVAQAVTWLNQERWKDYREAHEPPRLRVGMN